MVVCETVYTASRVVCEATERSLGFVAVTANLHHLNVYSLTVLTLRALSVSLS